MRSVDSINRNTRLIRMYCTFSGIKEMTYLAELLVLRLQTVEGLYTFLISCYTTLPVLGEVK